MNWLKSPRSTPSGGAFRAANSRIRTTSRPILHKTSLMREFIRASSDTTQACDAPDWQPFGHEDVAALEEDCSVRSDELARSEFAARLLAARADFSVRSFAVAELRDDFVLGIENADLTV